MLGNFEVIGLYDLGFFIEFCCDMVGSLMVVFFFVFVIVIIGGLWIGMFFK